MERVQPKADLLITWMMIGFNKKEEIIINDLTYSKLINKEEIEIFIYHHITENSESFF